MSAERGTVEYLAEVVLRQTQERLVKDHVLARAVVGRADVDLRVNPPGDHVHRGDLSGVGPVENATGIIFGIKGYGQVHKAVDRDLQAAEGEPPPVPEAGRPVRVAGQDVQ